MFLLAGPYKGSPDDLYSEIVRYCQTIDKPFIQEKKQQQNGIILYIYKDIMWPSERQRAIQHSFLECDTRFNKSDSYVQNKICN